MKLFDLPGYTEILESIQDGFVVVDKDLRYLYVNKKTEEIVGIPAKDLIGKKLAEAFPDHNLNLISLINIVKKAWFEKKVATLEIYFKPLHRWYFLTIYPFDDKYSVIFRDITEEKQTKEMLQNSQEQLSIIFKNVSDGIVIQDHTGKIIYANEAAAYMSGFASVKHMVEAPISTLSERFDIFDQQKRPVPWQNAPGRQVLDGKRDSVEAVLCFINKKTKEEIWADMKSAKISSVMEKEPCVITIFHNITVLKRLEQQKDNFISLVSHELKTPLTSLKAYVQILEKQYKKSHVTNTGNIIAKVSSNTEKLVELIHSLLDVSRIQEGKLKLKKRLFSLTSLLQEVAEDIRPITDHPISMVNKKNIFIYADRERIAQVLVNLITNAIKYSESTKRIVISSVQRKNDVVISVKDFGSGISQKDQQEIFKRFYQSAEHTTFPGLGLGLYISSEIIKEHGGTIWVKSKEGKGSTFFFTLPLGKKGSKEVSHTLD